MPSSNAELSRTNTSNNVVRTRKNLEEEQVERPNERQHPPDSSEVSTDACDVPSVGRTSIPPQTPSTSKILSMTNVNCDASETPRSFGTSHPSSSDFDGSQFDSLREYVTMNHGYVPCMSLRHFREYVLPRSLSNEDVERVLEVVDVEALKEVVLAGREGCQASGYDGGLGCVGGVVEGTRKIGEGGRGKQGNEAMFFEHVTKIYDEVVSAGNRVLKRKEISKISYNPTNAPVSLECETTTLPPDCNLVLAASTSCRDKPNDTDIYYCDVFATCMFKRHNTDKYVYDNRTSLIWNMRHIMQENPCRRFVFGISIEDKNMRIWQANRAGVFVSEEFDYVENLEDVLCIFAQLVFAKKLELGWDESIVRVAECTYEIRVGVNWYRTEKVLSSSAAGYLVGHACRVWLATLIGKSDGGGTEAIEDTACQVGAKQVVIKDVWSKSQTTPEHEVQELILSKLVEEERALLKKHLFTISAHEVVKIDGEEDRTQNTILRGLCVDGLAMLAIQPPVQQEDTHAPIGLVGSMMHNRPFRALQEYPKVHHRYHYRMVMDEVATPVWRLDDLEHALIAYCDTLIAVTLLSACGWVHRDISPENVYYYNGKGILGDFEFAQEIGPGKGSDAKAGTRGYMALEVEFNCYLFEPCEKVEIVRDHHEADWRTVMRNLKKAAPKPVVYKLPEPERKALPFFHNPLHDVESVWWGCVELLLKRRIEHDDLPQLIEEYKKSYYGTRAAASDVFPGYGRGGRRFQFFRGDYSYMKIMTVLPSALEEICNNLFAIRQDLLSFYAEVEKPGDGTVNAKAYSADYIAHFYSNLAVTVPFARGMKLKAFDEEWDRLVYAESLERGEESEVSLVGLKRDSSDDPADPRASKRLREES